MNFLRHPLYSAFAIGMTAWLSMANARGLSFIHSANPANWAMFAGSAVRGTGSGSHGWSHGSSHFSHK